MKTTSKKNLFLIPLKYRANLSWDWLSSLRFFIIIYLPLISHILAGTFTKEQDLAGTKSTCGGLNRGGGSGFERRLRGEEIKGGGGWLEVILIFPNGSNM